MLGIRYELGRRSVRVYMDVIRTNVGREMLVEARLSLKFVEIKSV